MTDTRAIKLETVTFFKFDIQAEKLATSHGLIDFANRPMLRGARKRFSSFVDSNPTSPRFLAKNVLNLELDPLDLIFLPDSCEATCF